MLGCGGFYWDNIFMSKGNKKLSDGLTYKLADFHIHTPASKDFVDKNVTPEQIVNQALEKNLDAIAVTDHNSAEWVDKIKDAAKNTKLTVFPGVEITSMGGAHGVHIIALFDPSCGKEDVDFLLSKLDLKPQDRGLKDSIIEKSVTEIAKEIQNAGGLTVLAHANSSSGAFKEISGQPRIKIATSKYINAAEASDCQDEQKEKEHKRTLDQFDGTNLDYKKRTLAIYQASDNPDADGSSREGHGLDGIGKRSTYFKVDGLSLEAIRQCFADPKVRIRYSVVTIQHPYLKSIEVEGGYYDGKSASFHYGLNSLLGGKGAGKSLLVEFLRFGLNQIASVDSVKTDHLSKLDKKLGIYGKVKITVVKSDGSEQVIERTYKPNENSPFTNEEMSTLADSFQVLFLSQNEIISIAENEKAQLEFIDKFFNFKHHKLLIEDLESQLYDWDIKLANCIRALKEVEDVKKLMANVANELVELDTKLKAPIFDELKKQESKKRYIEARKEELEKLSESFNDFSSLDFFEESEGNPEDSIKDEPLIKRLVDSRVDTKKNINQLLADAKESLRLAIEAVDAEAASFKPTYDEAKLKYEEYVRKSGGDGKELADKRAKKAKEHQDLQLRFNRLTQQSKNIKEVAAKRKEVLDKLKATYSAYADERKQKMASIQSAAKGRLQLKINIAEDKDEFTRRLSELKKGSYLKDGEIDQISKSIEPFELINNVLYYVITSDISFVEKIADKVKLDKDRVKVLVDFLIEGFEYEKLLELQYKAMPGDKPIIEYNVGDVSNPNYRPLSELSTGQKCTAMLIIALSDGNQPIVIDQPEDSLDIKSVWLDMCANIRKNKDGRQFVFTTHNSSLAVASDTDKFLVIEGNSTNGEVVIAGSMDRENVGDEVIRYLEGDLQAYGLKSEKYNIVQRLKKQN